MSEKDATYKPGEFITKSALKERGWTDLLIKTFLPEPHKTCRNPHYSSGSPMCLYKLSVAKKIERSKKFCVKFASIEKRKQGAKKAVKTKLANLRKDISEIKIEILKLPGYILLRRAIAHYNNMQILREIEGFNTCGCCANKNSDKQFLNRIEVNYLGHCMTPYEDKLDEISGRVGFSEGYVDIRKKIFDEIACVYPWLKDECDRQR